MNKHSVAIYLEYVGASLPPRGSGWRKIKCPFHEDKHASAGVNYDEQRFKCHGCGVGGDVYDLIIYKEGCNYREAVKFAEAISSTSNNGIFQTYRKGQKLPDNTGPIGRRSQNISSRSGGESISRTRRIQG